MAPVVGFPSHSGFCFVGIEVSITLATASTCVLDSGRFGNSVGRSFE